MDQRTEYFNAPRKCATRRQGASSQSCDTVISGFTLSTRQTDGNPAVGTGASHAVDQASAPGQRVVPADVRGAAPCRGALSRTRADEPHASADGARERSLAAHAEG